MKKRLSKVSLFSSLTIFTLLSTVVASFAWFMHSITMRNLDIDGNSAAAYFAYGDGLPYEEDAQGNVIHQPFGISHTRHLNNLSWLLYSGNSLVTGNKYFEIDTSALTNNTLDCSALTIPPIGTESNPFLGHFDGNDVIIEGLTITNDATKFTNKPNNITYNQSNAEIVGFFGVVGNLNDAYSGTYDSSINSLTDFTLKDITVESVTTNTLIGLAAGYVDADMDNVKVDGEVTLDVNDQEHTAKTSITDNISDYGLVGYSTKTGSGGSYSQKLSKYYSNGEGSGGGDGSDFGGSIDMLSLYNRLNKVYNEDSYDNGDFTVNAVTDVNGVTTKQKVENLDNHFAGLHNDDYSYTFNKHEFGNQNFYYLYGDYSPVSGQVTSNQYTLTTSTITGTQWTISQSGNSTYYFSATVNGTTHYIKMPTLTSKNNATAVSDTTTFSEASQFIMTNNGNSGGYRYYVNQTIGGAVSPVYLGLYNGTTARAYAYSPNSSSNKNYTTFYNSGSQYYVIYSNRNYFLSFNGSSWVGLTSNTNRATRTEYSQTNYLTINDNYICDVTVEEEAKLWFYLDNKIFSIVDDRIYYLIGTNSEVYVSNKVTKNNATSWTYSNNSFSYTYSGNTYYLDLSPSVDAATSKPNDISMENNGTGTYTDVVDVSESNSTTNAIPYSSFESTYIPLSVSQNNIYSTSSKNTGYILSGKESAGDTTESSRYQQGDIRVSRYDMSNIEGALGQSNFDNSKLFCITATSNSDYAYITDTFNSGNSRSSALSGITTAKSADDLYRYYDWSATQGGPTKTGARTAMGNVFTNDSENIYGLHFMDASISKTNLQTIPNALVNGKRYTSGLEMPKDSIDFNISENGYITFFAGTYFGVGYSSVNTTFFSLHKITRDDNDNITDIEEIETIYKDSSNHYYYNPTSTSGLTKLFDTEVLTNPTTFINNAVYYFEIPVSAGEYALGSVSGKNGAYLMYLDISASGEQVLVDTVSAYSITTISTGNAYPVGVDFVPISVSGDGGETIAISIASGEQGSLIIAISTKDISVTDTSSIANYAYKSSNCVVSNPNDNQFICNLSGAPPTPSGGGVRILNIDLSKTNGDTYSIRITDILSDDSGTIDSSTYELDSGSGFVNSTQSAIEALSTEINLTNLRELEIAATLSRASGTGEFITTYDTANCSDANKIVDVDIDKMGTTISISVTTGYTFKIGGTTYSNGSTY